MWICRTCLQTTTRSNCITLSDNSVESLTIRKKLIDCVPDILIDSVEDPIICVSCVTSLNVSFNFKYRCLQSETRLHTYVQRNKVNKSGIKLAEIFHALNNMIITADPNVVAAMPCSNTMNNVEAVRETAAKEECFLMNIVDNMPPDITYQKPKIENYDCKPVNLHFDSVFIESYDTEDAVQTETDNFVDTKSKIVCANEVNDLQNCIDIVKCEVEESDYKTFDVQSNSFLMHNSYCNDTLQAEINKPELYQTSVEIKDDSRPLNTPKSSKKKALEANDETVKLDAENHYFGCNNCAYTTNFKRNLVVHMKIHTGEKPFKCVVCSYECTTKSYLNVHMRTHTGEKPYICEVCNYKCNSKSCLNVHMKTHTAERPFMCKICSYKCIRRNQLNIHMKTHTGEKPFVCQICEYSFSQNGALLRHMKSHNTEKPFTCNMCNYKGVRKSNLDAHMKTHTGEKRFKCQICDYRFTENGGLQRHMKTHTGEKPFNCEVCNYKCITKGQLNVHMRIHTGEKPFECDVCSYKCRMKSNLKVHMKTHGEDKALKC